jgi:hypothetical protein
MEIQEKGQFNEHKSAEIFTEFDELVKLFTAFRSNMKEKLKTL